MLSWYVAIVWPGLKMSKITPVKFTEGFFRSLLRLLHPVDISICCVDCSGSHFQGSKESISPGMGRTIKRQATGFSVSFDRLDFSGAFFTSVMTP